MDFPSDFMVRTRQWLGDEYRLLEDALQEEPPVSIRINPAKQTTALSYEKVKWCETGYYLRERPAFTFDPLFHAGKYYVQEASSMFLEQAIKQHITSPVVCLDLCAAPGGKSTHLQSLLPEKSLLVSNEVIRSRSSVLKENLIKWGSPYTVVTNNDPKAFGQLTHLFDVVIADLPCSGEGMFRKDVNSRSEWSVANVGLCATRQRRIIHNVWDSLKPGGLLVYSTCTFNREENEDNIRYLAETLHAEILPLPVESDWQISHVPDTGLPAYRFYPHKVKGEGFFLALIRKPATYPVIRLNKAKSTQKANPAPAQVKDWLIKSADYLTETKEHIIQAIPTLYDDIYRFLLKHLHIVSAGIQVGEIKGKDILPLPSLALSTSFNQEAFRQVDLSWDEAISYLQKEMLVLPDTIPNGWVVVKYQNEPLGFMKNIGNRANNLYPQEWRIRSHHMPLKAPGII